MTFPGTNVSVTALLCNHAEAQNNLLYVSGAGISRSLVPPGTPPPYASSLGIGMLLTVPWTQTNQPHQVAIDLVDEDTNAVPLPEEAGEGPAFHGEFNVNVGRPPDLQIGDDQTVALAFNMPMLAVGRLGRYRFLIKVDGADVAELAWALIAPPGTMTGSGPSALPQF
jgi:hypothetical protein